MKEHDEIRFTRAGIKSPKVILSVYVPYTLSRVIDDIAKTSKLTRSAAIRQLVEMGVRDVESGEDLTRPVQLRSSRTTTKTKPHTYVGKAHKAGYCQPQLTSRLVDSLPDAAEMEAIARRELERRAAQSNDEDPTDSDLE